MLFHFEFFNFAANIQKLLLFNVYSACRCCCSSCCVCVCVCRCSPLFCCLMKHFKHIKFLLYACVCKGVRVCVCVLLLARLVVCRHVAVCFQPVRSATAICDLIVSPPNTHTYTHTHTYVPQTLFYVGSRFMAPHNLQHFDTLRGPRTPKKS